LTTVARRVRSSSASCSSFTPASSAFARDGGTRRARLRGARRRSAQAGAVPAIVYPSTISCS
jgi:hypothetical protein